MSVCLLHQVRDTTQEPCGRLSFMKEPKSTRGLVHQAICNLNITLPIYTKVPWIILIYNDLYCHQRYLVSKGWVGGQNAVKALQAGVLKSRYHPRALSLLGFLCQCLKDSEEMTGTSWVESSFALCSSRGFIWRCRGAMLSLFHTAVSPRCCSGARRLRNSMSTSGVISFPPKTSHMVWPCLVTPLGRWWYHSYPLHVCRWYDVFELWSTEGPKCPRCFFHLPVWKFLGFAVALLANWLVSLWWWWEKCSSLEL